MKTGGVYIKNHDENLKKGFFNNFDHIIVQMKKTFEGQSDEDDAFLVNVLQPKMSMSE